VEVIPLRCVEGFNLSFEAADLRETPTLSLFLCDVIVAAGDHVVLKS